MNRLVRSSTPLFHAFSLPSASSSSSRFPTSSLRSTTTTSTPSLSRPLSTSFPLYASEAPSSPFSQSYLPTDASLFDKIQANPGLLKAIQHLTKIAKIKTGVDLESGDRPTIKMMTKLANDPELREAAEDLMAALKAAQIEVDPIQAFEALKTIGNGFEGLGDISELRKKGKGWPFDDEGGENGNGNGSKS